jgi:hypothetical protein
MAPRRTIQAGTQLAFWGQVDSSGFFAGTSGNVASGANGEPMGRLLGIQTANPGPVEPESVNVPGDDTTLGAIDFGPDEVPTWIMELGAHDLNNQALMQGTAVEQLGDINLGVLQPNDPEYPDICLIYQGKAKSKDSGSDGVKAWAGYIVPLASSVPLGRAEFTGRAAASDRYKVTAQVASRKPWGVTIRTSELGTSGAPLIPFTSDNPIVMERFTGDGVTTVFNLTHTPISAAKTVIHINTQRMVAGVDYSVDASAKQITFNVPPVDLSKIEILMEFSP